MKNDYAVASVDGRPVVSGQYRQGRILLDAVMPKHFFELADSDQAALGELLGQEREEVTVIDPISGSEMIAYRAVDPVNDDKRIWIDRKNPSVVFRAVSRLLSKRWHARFESSIEPSGAVRRAMFTGYCLAVVMQHGGELTISESLRGMLGRHYTTIVESELTRAYVDQPTTPPVPSRDVASSISAIITDPNQFPPR